MKISYNWLKNYINVDIPVERVAEILTETGLEVEGIEHTEAVKGGLEGVVIGHVVDLYPHENADKLRVAKVDIGEEELQQIVCGASNIAKDQKVVVAKVGATLYPQPDEPFKIKKAKIRGVASFGMICAEDELGLGDVHDGIMVVDPSAVIGMPAAEFFDLKHDDIIEIGLTPNRTDAMGHIGVARDLKAYLNFHHNQKLNLNLPDVPDMANGAGVKIEIEDADLCPDYRMLLVTDVQVKPSPEWLAKALRSIGLQPKNNIVDVTNYVMHECGHPLHAFDGEMVRGEIVVRKARAGEVLKTLDAEERKLDPSDLVIANRQEAMCIAGVMGGEKSGVKEGTKTVCIESAYFQPTSVRKSAKRHGIHSDASFRFERGANPEVLDWALRRAAQLIMETSGGVIKGGIAINTPQPFQPAEVNFSPENCRKLIGAHISDDEMLSIFDLLGMVVHKTEGIWKVMVPGYRAEVTREADLVEEILRIYGVNNIPLPEKMKITPQASIGKKKVVLRDRIAQYLAGAGWTEIMNNSLTSSQYLELREDWNNDTLVKIKNPLSNELDVMRPDMLMGGLQSMAYNINRKNDHLRFFEIGTVYSIKNEGKFAESKDLSFFMTSGEEENNWQQSPDNGFYVLKNTLENVGDICGVTFDFKNTNIKSFAKVVTLSIGEKNVGEAGIVLPKLAQKMGIKKEVFYARLNWDALLKKQLKKKLNVVEVPTTLPVKRDFSLLLDSKLTFSQIKAEVMNNYKGNLLRDIQLFDVYEGDKLPAGKKSYAIKFILQDHKKTLNDKTIDKQMEFIRKILEENLGAELR